MKFLNELSIIESAISSEKEINHIKNIINGLYNDWKKIKRRINSVDIIINTTNKLSNIDPDIVNFLPEAIKLKLASLLIRCFDIPYWKKISEKESIFKKLAPLVQKMQNFDPNTGTDGTVKDVIMSRLSTSICYNSNNREVYVAYEPKIPDSYLRYLFNNEIPEVTYKMRGLTMPMDFDQLVNMLKINHEKAVTSYRQRQKSQDQL